jgi:ribosomal protein L12E/L44/L45/RPP1/RPP2
MHKTYHFDRKLVLCELVLHYKVRHVLETLGIAVEKRDVLAQQRRLFGADFDAPSALAPPPAAAAAAAPPAKVRKVEQTTDK